MRKTGQLWSGLTGRSRRSQTDEAEGSHSRGEEDAALTETPSAHIIAEVDAPFLDLQGDREHQAYNHLKDHTFLHTPLIDPDLLEKTGMDIEFATIWKAVGW